MLAWLATAAHAQQAPAAATPEANLDCQVLTGRVTDPFAYPLMGATIMLRSPNNGFSPEAFSTNSEGHYIVTVKQSIPRNTVMEITAVGYATLELPLSSCRPLDLTLVPLSNSYKGKARVRKAQGSRMR